ncbi:MAG: type IV pilus modification protein PilV [Ramlibacter sp.]
MLNRPGHCSTRPRKSQRGVGLIEILVSVLITSFGLLALAGLQSRVGQAQFESYQRAQALTLLADLTQRIQANVAQASTYVTASTVGTGDTGSTACSTLTTRSDIDLCEWSRALRGAAETSGGSNVGAMIGARGCVELVEAADTTSGICRPATYRVTVAWQGLASTVAPGVACAKDLYGADSQRRAISSQVVTPLPTCS